MKLHYLYCFELFYQDFTVPFRVLIFNSVFCTLNEWYIHKVCVPTSIPFKHQLGKRRIEDAPYTISTDGMHSYCQRCCALCHYIKQLSKKLFNLELGAGLCYSGNWISISISIFDDPRLQYQYQYQ